MSDIEGILSYGEVLTSKELIHRVTERMNLSPIAARKVISRLSKKGNIWRSEACRLQRDERFFARPEFVVSTEFAKVIIPQLLKVRPGLGWCFEALQDGGILLKSQAELLLGTQLVTPGGHSKTPTYGKDCDALLELSIARRECVDTQLEHITRSNITPDASIALAKRERARSMMEASLTKILLDHFRLQNFVSWGSVSTFDASKGLLPFNGYGFHGYAFSFLAPLIRKGADGAKSLPVVLEVHSRPCKEYDVGGFLQRIRRISNRGTKTHPVLGVLAATDFEKVAHKKAKGAGLMVINLRQLFGERALDLLASAQSILARTLATTDAPSQEEIEQLSKEMEEIKASPFVADLRAVGLETLTALVLSLDGYENIAINTHSPWPVSATNQTTRDLDVWGISGNRRRAYLVECKAEERGKPLSRDYVNKFFMETVPAFLKNEFNNHLPPEVKAEIWTTGTVTKDALDALDACNIRSGITSRLVDYDGIIAKLSEPIASCKRLLAAIRST